MKHTFALAGKGGTGKTTIAGMLIRFLVDEGKTPVLAVDADANANLNEVLGLNVEETLGDAREEMKKGVSTGMTKDVFMEMKIQQAIVEARGFDLIVMGRPEGPGCYCAANSLLTQFLDKLVGNYESVVIDNEAGMEHISRLTTNNIDILLVISDPTRRGIQTAARIVELSDQLKLDIGQKLLLVNQAKEGQDAVLKGAVQEYGLELVGTVPYNEELEELDLQGRSLSELDPGNKALEAAQNIFRKILTR